MPLNEMASVTITNDDDINQMQIANTDEKEGVWYDILRPKDFEETGGGAANGGGDSDDDEEEDDGEDLDDKAMMDREVRRTTRLRSSAVAVADANGTLRGGMGDPRASGDATMVGRIRLRLRLVRPETHHDVSRGGAVSELN